MALIKCQECGKEISSAAMSCPSCGCPTNQLSKLCPDCGARISHDAEFCPKCHVLQVSQRSKTANTLQEKPAITSSTLKEKPWYKRWWAIAIFAILAISIIRQLGTSPEKEKSVEFKGLPKETLDQIEADRKNAANQPNANIAPSDPRMGSAQKIMEDVRHLANVYEEGSHLVVEFNTYLFPNDINKRLAFVRAVADADSIIQGKARSIFFYNPGGKKIAKADTSNGVRLTD